MATPKTVLAKLREPFSADQVKTRPGGGGQTLDYVAIETVLERLLDLAPEYSWNAEIVAFEDGVAVVKGDLIIGEKSATGVGAMKNSDPDMAVKSANSEALKNAAKNGFGIALELWNAEHRKSLQRQRKLGSATPAQLKQEVWKIAKGQIAKANPTAKDVAEYFNVEPSALGEEGVLRKILEDEGLL